MQTSTRNLVSPLAILSLLTLLLTGCSGAQVDRGQTDTFAETGYRTYSWNYEAVAALPTDKTPYALVSGIFREELNAVLKNLGYREVAEGGEFVVSAQFKQSISDGVVSVTESDPTFATQAIINRDPDRASLDNAQALAGPRPINNVLIQFDDASDGSLLWAAAISRVIENANANEVDPDRVRRFAKNAIRRATIQLPNAPD